MTKYDERRRRFPARWKPRHEQLSDEPAVSKRRVLHAEVARAVRTHDGSDPSWGELTTSTALAVLPSPERHEEFAPDDAVPTMPETSLGEYTPEYTPEDLGEDTIIMPIVGDRVHYVRGSSHLVGLLGVVVAPVEEAALPSGLRYVLFDDEEWPTVVTVTKLDRE